MPAPTGHASGAADAESFPHWFTQFLYDRQTRKPSAHTMKAYRQDFIAIATLMTDGHPARLTVADITKDSMRQAFAAYARDHEAASIRRCWSTWNVLCTFLYTGEQVAANPMQLVGRPKLAKPLPRALPRTAVEALLATVADDRDSKRRTDWAERDLALIFTGLLAGLRAEELQRADVGDIRTTDDGAAVIHVKGKGGKERSVPIEAELLSVIEAYLDSRAIRFPGTVKRRTNAAEPRPYPNGPREPRCSLGVTANGSRGERCSRASSGHSNVPAPTRNLFPVRSCTACATPTPPNSPTLMSASTR
jgi:integrase/recombinase XerC